MWGGVHRSDRISDIKVAEQFVHDNKNRIRTMFTYLADDYSRNVWKSVMAYRCGKINIIPDKYYSENDVYFPRERIFELYNDTVFVDCGAYKGDTLFQFKRYAKREKIIIKKMIAFERDKEKADFIRRMFPCESNIIVIEKGCFSYNGVASITPSYAPGHIVCEVVPDEVEGEGVIHMPVVTLDSIDECKDATFIKMDIEGSEFYAIKGAKNIIKRNHPVLAICIYHSLDDMLRLVEYIHNMDNNYRIYIRHHSPFITETVMYCVYDEH